MVNVEAWEEIGMNDNIFIESNIIKIALLKK
jgi:hypothetical protein